MQEANKCKTELQYWRSKSPATPINGNEIPVDDDAERADVNVSTEDDSNRQLQQLAVKEFTDDFNVTAGGAMHVVFDAPTIITTADALNETQQIQILQTDLITMVMAVSPTPDASAAYGDLGCDGSAEVYSRPSFGGQRGADTEPVTDAIAHGGGNSVICSVGLPATTVKSNAKRRFETESAAGGSTSLAGNSSAALATGNSGPSDMKKARRVQNKASRSTTSNVITNSKITRSK